QVARSVRLSPRRFPARSPTPPPSFRSSLRRRQKLGRAPLPLPLFQQQQVHRRHHAHRSAFRPHRRPDRIRPLGPHWPPRTPAHAAETLRRHAHPASASLAPRRAPCRIQLARSHRRHDRRRNRHPRLSFARHHPRRRGHAHMKRAYFALRSALLWILTLVHFFIAAPFLVFLNIFLDMRKHDWLQRAFCRRIAFLSGARVKVIRSPGFDPQRTSFFMANHVNVFEPFILYCAIPQLVRGWELESHFKIPAYGWLMKRFGNVPVPDVRRPSDIKRMWRLTHEAINRATSLIIFPEAKRTRNGHVDEFQDGGFRLAQQLGVPIVPVSLVGS